MTKSQDILLIEIIENAKQQGSLPGRDWKRVMIPTDHGWSFSVRMDKQNSVWKLSAVCQADMDKTSLRSLITGLYGFGTLNFYDRDVAVCLDYGGGMLKGNMLYRDSFVGKQLRLLQALSIDLNISFSPLCDCLVLDRGCDPGFVADAYHWAFTKGYNPLLEMKDSDGGIDRKFHTVTIPVDNKSMVEYHVSIKGPEQGNHRLPLEEGHYAALESVLALSGIRISRYYEIRDFPI